VYDPIQKETFALKIVDFQCIEMLEDVVTSYKNEIDLLIKLKECKCVVHLYEFECLESEKKLLMLMEKGDSNMKIVLNPFVADDNELKQHEPHAIKFYFNEMVKAVNEIHNFEVVHADLKPENFILINGKVKLIDFGISSVILENQTSIYKESPIGTFGYMSPETLTLRTAPIYKDKEKRKVIKYNCKTDIWSLGCILYDMASGLTPFQNCRNKIKAILDPNHKIDYSKIGNQQLVDCIKKCLQHDQTKRPTANELLQHPYLA
jgi:serine/threonine-protein kinase TTK/MPS1